MPRILTNDATQNYATFGLETDYSPFPTDFHGFKFGGASLRDHVRKLPGPVAERFFRGISENAIYSPFQMEKI